MQGYTPAWPMEERYHIKAMRKAGQSVISTLETSGCWFSCA